jgi:hypothetical protein
MGVDFAKAALAAGHSVVATGRNPEAVRSVVGGACASAYAASKFGLEGWMEGLAGEVEPMGSTP